MSFVKSVSFMDSQMTSEEAVQIIINYLTDKEDKVVDVALNMCMIDISSYGVDEWVTWSDFEIVHLFRNVADDTLTDLIDEIMSKSAGEDIIDELLGSDQTERIDYKRALSGMKNGSVDLFNALIKYMELHEEVKGHYYLVE
mgnify:FL=1|jgi:hypothetical protein